MWYVSGGVDGFCFGTTPPGDFSPRDDFVFCDERSPPYVQYLLFSPGVTFSRKTSPSPPPPGALAEDIMYGIEEKLRWSPRCLLVVSCHGTSPDSLRVSFFMCFFLFFLLLLYTPPAPRFVEFVYILSYIHTTWEFISFGVRTCIA